MLKTKFFQKNPYKVFGISKRQTKEFRKNLDSKIERLLFKNIPITISNPFWFLHSVDELFIDEVYKFQSKTSAPVIIDCGANWGLSIIYFKHLYPKCRIIGFEPDPRIFKILENNIKNAGFTNVEILNKAVWKKDEALSFSSDNSLGGTISNLKINKNSNVEVEAIRFKNFIKLYKHIDFLKIDIEGAEYDVINDCKDSLNHIDNLFIEYHSSPNTLQHLHDILSIVSNAGFRYYVKEAWNNMQHPFIYSKQLYYDLQLNIFCYRI